MSRITFNVASKCDKAGRAQNQDNYLVCPNLEKPGDTSAIGDDSEVDLSAKGALFVVADGMGGMKSGEKASEYVIAGIKEKFAHIPADVLQNESSIISYIRKAIVEADNEIKKYAADHRESEGMGSTIVLLWLLGEKAYCGWCGDSRIYCFNPQNTLVRLSHDHSYVQSLVDEGKITEEEAFDHPDSNIITRSLGDNGEKANPEVKVYPVHRRDVFLLCSDGLCGLLNDEQIENILAENSTSSKEALKALWAKGEQEGWSDNATVEVVCVTDGAPTPSRKAIGYDTGKPKPKPAAARKEGSAKGGSKGNVERSVNASKNGFTWIFVLVALCVAGALVWYFMGSNKTDGSSNQEYFVEQGEEATSDNPEEIDNLSDNIRDHIENKERKGKEERTGKPTENGQKPEKNQASGADNQSTYIAMLSSTYSSKDAVSGAISAANNSKRLTPQNESIINSFVSKVNTLNNKLNKSSLTPDQSSKLRELNNLRDKANNVKFRCKRTSGSRENADGDNNGGATPTPKPTQKPTQNSTQEEGLPIYNC